SASMANAFVMPEGTVVEPKGYLTVLCDSAAAPQPGELLASFNISRSGEKLYLETPGGSVSEFAVPQLAQDISYARGEDGKYGFSPQPSFCAANGPVYPTLVEALQHGEHPQELRINELGPGSEGWVEIKNVSGETVSCSAYYLSDDAGTPFKWHFPETELGPNALLTVELNGRDTSAPLAASFKVSRSENALYIFNEAGDRVDSFTFETPVPEGVSVVAAEGGVAYTSRVTKGEENSEYTFDSLEWNEIEVDRELYINEVLPGNKYGLIDSYGDRSDWVELKNPLDVPVELDRYYLSDDPEEPLKWRLPKVALLPGKYALIFLSGRGTEGDYPAEIHAPFSLSGGESIVLSTLDGMRTQSIEIPEDLPSNVSIGRNGAGELRYYTAPTPGAPNSTHALDQYADAGLFDPDSVYISEVCAVSPARSGGSDWVELKNGSGNTVSLAGWRLTDDIDEPDKFTFGSRSISSGGYTVVTCSDTAKAGNGSAPFSVSNSGETLFLIDPNGAVRDVFETGVTQVGVTSGRANGSEDGARCFFETATKGAKNASPLTGVTAEPTFSSTKLYCSSAFELTISCSTPGAQIRYTTDGSVPNKNSKLYSGPITVSENKVFHAVAYLDGFTKSPMAVKTFIFDPEYTMPVVSISLSSSDYSRMYVAKAKPNGGVTKGDEVACYMEYYVDGRLAISSGAGVRVSGASTAVDPQKSLGLYFRSGYGRSSLDYPLFEGCDVTSFRSLTLRNGGQDAYYARMRDSYMSRICQGMDIDVAYFRPVIVYINGNYRGIYDMKENLNEDYLVSHYGIIRSTAEIGSRNGYMLAGTKDLWSKMRGMCQTLDFSKQENFDKLSQLVDTDCVIDYLVARTYFYDGDMFNQKYWHTTDNKIKWRPVFFDSDYAMMGNYLGGNILGL
ncbi:MAG: lamin tail domain-containing protein, partial [Clostridia bacterium]|nr:lamin tail domain-containing protein [Clostridia bacterium]